MKNPNKKCKKIENKIYIVFKEQKNTMDAMRKSFWNKFIVEKHKPISNQ